MSQVEESEEKGSSRAKKVLGQCKILVPCVETVNVENHGRARANGLAVIRENVLVHSRAVTAKLQNAAHNCDQTLTEFRHISHDCIFAPTENTSHELAEICLCSSIWFLYRTKLAFII